GHEEHVVERGAHPGRRTADFAAALREMTAPDGEQRALDIHRHVQPRTPRQLSYVEVAGELARRDGAESLIRHLWIRRHRVPRIRRQDHAAALEQPLLARGDPRQLRARRRNTERACERSPPDPYAGDSGGFRVATRDPPREPRRIRAVLA